MPRVRRLTGHEKKVVAAASGWKCAACSGTLDAFYEIDHIVPLHKGGEDSIDNCQALHRMCHAKKTQAEEADRIRNNNQYANRCRRAPLACTRCGRVLSPYFAQCIC